MTQSQLDEKLNSLDKQIKKLFSLLKGTQERQEMLAEEVIKSTPTDIELTQAHEWRKSRERIYPPRESQYGAVYYRPNDLDKILADYKRS